MENGYRNFRQRPQNQIILQSSIRVSQNGIEMQEFTIPFGAFELHVSTPIPEEGTDGAPVYVQMRAARQERQPQYRRQECSEGYDDESYDEGCPG